MKSKFVILLLLIVYVIVTFNRGNEWKYGDVLHWDQSGYYIYLPALFIYNDLSTLSFYPEMNTKYAMTPGAEYYAVFHYGDKLLNKYSAGVAIMELPFFLVAHAVSKATSIYPADGYSPFYQLAVILSTICWVIIGLLALRRLLLRYFSDNVTSITLVLIAFGTNLYSYTIFDAGMSHPYSFALFALATCAMDTFLKTGKTNSLVYCGLYAGLLIIVRPANVLFTIVLLFWSVDSIKNLQARFLLFVRRWRTVVWATLACLLVIAIQASYWYYITEHFIHDSYEDEGFNFLQPSLWKGLFSYRKGWFVYTPMAFVAVAAFYFLYKQHRKLFYTLFAYMCINVYVVFSWYAWEYGGSFGCRALVETYAVLAFPLAALLTSLANQRRNSIKIGMGLLFIAFVGLNLFQTYQFSFGTIPWDHMNREYYWRIFGKVKATDDDWKLLNFNEGR